jgi:peptidoglycan/LPS O-acetylase OafA/YrhL
MQRLKLPVNSRKAMRVLLVPIIIAPVCRVMGYRLWPLFLAPVTRHFSFFAYFDSLAYGCICGILLARYINRIQAKLLKFSTLTAVVGFMLLLLPSFLEKVSTSLPINVALPYLPAKMSFIRSFTVPFGPSLQGIGFSILLLQSIISPVLWFYRCLNWKWVGWIGVLSYSIYIWQQLFCNSLEQFHVEGLWWLSWPGWLGSVMIASIVSYYGLERPLLKLRASFRSN